MWLGRAKGWWPGGRCCQGRLSSGAGFWSVLVFFNFSSRDRPLLTVTTPHTAKTLAKFVAELRQKVRARTEQWHVLGQVRALDEKKQEEFFSLSVGRPELCTRDRG